VGRLFVPGRYSLRTDKFEESPVYYVDERPSRQSRYGIKQNVPLDYRVERNTKVDPQTYIGKAVVPQLLVIHDDIRSIDNRPHVEADEYEIKRFARFVGQDGIAPTPIYGVSRLPAPYWELDIVRTFSKKKNGVIDMGDVVAYAAGLGNARSAFWRFLEQQRRAKAASAKSQ
jgi:hypothetical protein